MKLPILLAALGVTLLSQSASQAITIAVPNPEYGTFGTLAGATFGGSGIPNTAVGYTTFTDGSFTGTIGLTAHARFANAPVTSNGAGVFQAEQGGDTLNGSPALARWNIGIYVDTDVPGTWQFYYDTDPSANTSSTTFYGGFGDYQESTNLGFGFYDTPIGPFLGNTNGVNFDPTVAGEYRFAVTYNNLNGQEIARASMIVNAGNPTSNVPDGGFTLAMLGASLISLGAVRQRRK